MAFSDTGFEESSSNGEMFLSVLIIAKCTDAGRGVVVARPRGNFLSQNKAGQGHSPWEKRRPHLEINKANVAVNIHYVVINETAQ